MLLLICSHSVTSIAVVPIKTYNYIHCKGLFTVLLLLLYISTLTKWFCRDKSNGIPLNLSSQNVVRSKFKSSAIFSDSRCYSAEIAQPLKRGLKNSFNTKNCITSSLTVHYNILDTKIHTSLPILNYPHRNKSIYLVTRLLLTKQSTATFSSSRI